MNLEPAHEEQLHEGSTFPMGDPCCLDGGGHAWAVSASMEIREKNRVFGIWARASGPRQLLPRLRFKKTRFPLGSDVAVRMVCFVHNAMDLSCNMRGSSRLKK